MWSDADDEILAGDLTAALAYVTPAGGAVLTPVSPFGMRDREARTVSFTTSLGFDRKLERIASNPNVALAFHAREHGFATGGRFVLVQGSASFQSEPDPDVLTDVVAPASERFMGPGKSGPFWSRWLRAYQRERVLVTVHVRRVLTWSEPQAAGEPQLAGDPLPQAPAPEQSPPRNGTAPRVDAQRAAQRARALAPVLLAYVGADGLPVSVPVSVAGASAAGIELAGPLPAGGRRAGLLAHRYEAHLIGLEVRQYTGWLQDGVYAPHTEAGFRAPANKTVLLLANGFMARRGLRRARARGVARRAA